MAKLDEITPTARRLLEELSAQITGGEQPVLIPSLLRHFAHDPAVPGLLWESLRPVLVSSGFDEAVASVSARALEVASTLPYRVTVVEDAATRAIVERFVRTIPAMIITGALIGRALGGVLDDTAP